jgi:NADH-quinone oxidoreductase subunit A
MFPEYGALLLNLIICGAVAIGLVVTTSIIGPKRMTEEKKKPFETGYVLPHPRRRPYRPGFLLYAILFVVFDMEIAFLYPWAVSFGRLGAAGFVVVMFFLAVLFLGLIYAWRKGALEWE